MRVQLHLDKQFEVVQVTKVSKSLESFLDILSKMGGLMSTFFGVFRALVYFYQRNHVVQHACDEVYLLQNHKRPKTGDKKKTFCCCERSDSDEKPKEGGKSTLELLTEEEK